MAGLFQTIITGVPNLDRIQANVSSAFNSSGLPSPFVGGQLLTAISLSSSTPKSINHGLGRQPVIWVLADITAAAEVYRTAWDTNSITLEATADCTVAIWVN